MITIGYTNGQQIVNNVVHLVDLPDHLKNEHVCQIIYNLIKNDPDNAQNHNQLAHVYSVIHEIDFNKYMQGIMEKNTNIISLMVTEVTNALGTIGIVLDPDQLALTFLY